MLFYNYEFSFSSEANGQRTQRKPNRIEKKIGVQAFQGGLASLLYKRFRGRIRQPSAVAEET